MLAAAPELSSSQVQAAMMVVAGHPAALRSLAAALIADPGALTVGAPPVVGALVTELAARGAPSLPEPACALRRRPGLPLTRSVAGGICARCGRLRRIARRADGGQPDICDGCFRLPTADCARCGRARPCSFASGSDRSASAARHNGSAHASAATSSRPLRRTGPKGRVCDPCYAAALRHRGTCDSCRATRRLVVPAGPDATTCADCAGLDPHPRVHRLRDRGQAAGPRASSTRAAGANGARWPAAPVSCCDPVVASRSRPRADGRSRSRHQHNHAAHRVELAAERSRCTAARRHRRWRAGLHPPGAGHLSAGTRRRLPAPRPGRQRRVPPGTRPWPGWRPGSPR